MFIVNVPLNNFDKFVVPFIAMLNGIVVFIDDTLPIKKSFSSEIPSLSSSVSLKSGLPSLSKSLASITVTFIIVESISELSLAVIFIV
jgi:hypothetical protein